MAGQSGYTVHFEEANQAAEQLSQILDEFAGEIKNINAIEEEMLSDENWRGPNKSAYQSEFAEYRAALEGLYQNGVEHLQSLQRMLASYANAEQ